jgi:hypothetical protein
MSTCPSGHARSTASSLHDREDAGEMVGARVKASGQTLVESAKGKRPRRGTQKWWAYKLGARLKREARMPARPPAKFIARDRTLPMR